MSKHLTIKHEELENHLHHIYLAQQIIDRINYDLHQDHCESH